jgi:hypothetical protein
VRIHISRAQLCRFIANYSGVPVLVVGVIGRKGYDYGAREAEALTSDDVIAMLRRDGYWVFEQRFPRHAWVIVGPEALSEVAPR